MKVEVIKKFKDKHTGEIHKKGKILELTPERVGEILEVGKFVEPIKEEAPAEPEETSEEPEEAPAEPEKKSGSRRKKKEAE